MSKIVVLLAFLIGSQVYAGWQFRAREHFDLHDVITNTDKNLYFGLSNTINFGLEKRNEYYYALAFNPILGDARLFKSANTYYGEEIKVWMLGLEGKYHINNTPFYGRAGVHWSRLANEQQRAPDGVGGYLGAGYEIEIFKDVTLVPELAFRYTEFDDDSRMVSGSFSLGLHFYNSGKLGKLFCPGW